MKTKSIAKGAIILTLANIITRILGFLYRVYMSNVIGAEGMGLYQLITPIYMLVWSISSSGLSTTISKLIAQENALKNYGNMGRILKQSMAISLAISSILSLIVFLFSDEISIYILKDERTIISLKLLSTCFPFMALGSCIRGYFFGLQESKFPAYSQVFEQIIRMTVIFFLAGLFIPKGIEYASALAVIGMCMGEIVSFFYVFFSYKNFKRKNILNKRPTTSSLKIAKNILKTAIPLTANRVTGSFLSTIENILIPQKLKLFGLTVSEAMSLYGQLSGMAMPLIMFPSSLLTALSIALVPAISEATASGKKERITSSISKAMSMTTLIGICTGGLFITFPYEIGMLIYNQEQIGELLFLMGLTCPFLYIQVTLSGILNGLGEQVFIFRNSIISSFINIMFIWFCIPKYGINAFIIGWLISMFIVSILDIKRIIKRTKLKINFSEWFFKPFICILFCCLSVKMIYSKVLIYYGEAISLIISICAIIIVYIILLIFLGAINVKEIKIMLKNAIKK